MSSGAIHAGCAGSTITATRERHLALVLGAAGLHVLRRGTDGTWRAAISLLDLEPTGEPMSQDTQSLAPIATPAGAGEARWWFGALAGIKITAAQTGGLLSMLEITEPPDVDGPPHVHHREDEAFWILDGDATFEGGDATIEAHAGPAPLLDRPRRLRGCSSS
jgi:mannose-6-phosphate isomerase-like protein (cupin superfamily)